MTELELRHKEIEEIVLTPEEVEKAIRNYKVWKWNHERNREYWLEQELKSSKNAKTVRRSD